MIGKLEAIEAFKYLKDDLFDSIKDGCNFDTFMRLTLDRYISEETCRLEGKNDISNSGSMVCDVIKECEKLYNSIQEKFENGKLVESDKDWCEDICLSDRDLFDDILKG